jgi:hypothetical protein
MSLIKTHNLATDEIIEREMTSDELIEWQKNKEKAELELQAEADKLSAKAALLEKLGITEDEARLLIGGI